MDINVVNIKQEPLDIECTSEDAELGEWTVSSSSIKQESRDTIIIGRLRHSTDSNQAHNGTFVKQESNNNNNSVNKDKNKDGERGVFSILNFNLESGPPQIVNAGTDNRNIQAQCKGDVLVDSEILPHKSRTLGSNGFSKAGDTKNGTTRNLKRNLSQFVSHAKKSKIKAESINEAGSETTSVGNKMNDSVISIKQDISQNEANSLLRNSCLKLECGDLADSDNGDDDDCHTDIGVDTVVATENQGVSASESCHLPMTQLSEIPQTCNSVSSSGKQGSEQFKCIICEQSFKILRNLVVHMSSHLEEEPHKGGDSLKSSSQEPHKAEEWPKSSSQEPHKVGEWPKSSSQEPHKVRERPKSSSQEPHKVRERPKSSSQKPEQLAQGRKKTKPFKCTVCGREFKKWNQLHFHKRAHPVESLIKCNFCDQTFTKLVSLDNHMKTHTYKCEQCGDSFTRKSTFEVHMKVCKKSFKRKPNFVMHMESHTGEMPPKSKDSLKASCQKQELVLGRKKATPYKCTVCGKEFRQLNRLLLHKRVHPGESLIKCELCEQTFTNQHSLINHMRVHAFKCELCSHSFTTLSSLEIHMRTHSGEKSSKRKAPDNSICVRRSLRKQSPVRTAKKPLTANYWNCNICSTSFGQRSSLNKHLKNIHPEEKPHKCSRCETSFGEYRNLKEHWKVCQTLSGKNSCTLTSRENICTSEKHHKCLICGTSFVQKNNLYRHLRRKHPKERSHICPRCQTSFDNYRSLKNHLEECPNQSEKPLSEIMRIPTDDNKDPIKDDLVVVLERLPVDSVDVDEEKPFKCSKCEMDFSSKSSFETHLKEHSDSDVLYEDGSGPVGGCNDSDASQKAFAMSGADSVKVPSVHEESHDNATLDGSEPVERHNDRDGSGKDVAVDASEPDGGQSDSDTQHEEDMTLDDSSPDEGQLDIDASIMVWEGSESVLGKLPEEFITNEGAMDDKHVSGKIDNSLGSKSFPCETCGKVFFLKSLRNRHAKTHILVKKYSCQFCPKTFSFKCHLSEHQKVHSSERQKYNCPKCDKKFLRKESLGYHMHIHTGDRPHKCHHCDKSYPERRQLNRHMKFKHSFSCFSCLKVFSNKIDLDDHYANEVSCRPSDGSSKDMTLDSSEFIQGHNDSVDGSRKDLTSISVAGKQPEQLISDEDAKDDKCISDMCDDSVSSKYFPCGTCKKVFSSKSSRNKHAKIHILVKQYCCQFCSKTFSFKSRLNEHEKKHSSERQKFKCPTCDKDFLSKKSVRSHIMRIHTGDRPHMCHQCGKSYPELKQLNQHIKHVHLFSCLNCLKAFSNKINLDAHYAIEVDCRPSDGSSKDMTLDGSLPVPGVTCEHLNTNEDAKDDKPISDECDNLLDLKSFPCDTCEKVFFSIGLRNQHAKLHVKEYCCRFCSKAFSYKKSLNEHEKTHSSEREKFPCPICDKEFLCKESVAVHLRVHTGERPHKCTRCTKSFCELKRLNHHIKRVHPTCSSCKKVFFSRTDLDDHYAKEESCRPSSDLRIHERIHTGEKPFLCSKCDNSFVTKLGLQEHERTHTGEKRFHCSICGKGYAYIDSLQQHMGIHTGVKPYKCELCDKRFFYPSQCREHKRTHTGEKPYTCSICSKALSSYGSLKNHMMVHTGEKNFMCSFCSKTYNRKDHLREHEMKHRGETPFMCTYCPAAYTRKSELLIHTRSHTGEKPYQCSICGKGFRTNGWVAKHVRSVHMKSEES